jgi:hypothetical protein
MENEIIYTEDYALIVSELTSPGKEGQVFLTKENIIHTVVGWNYGDRLIIGHRPLTDAPILNGVLLMPEFSQEEDVEKLAFNELFPVWDSKDTLENLEQSQIKAFKIGYNKAKETYNLTLSRLVDLYVEKTGYGMDMWNKEENNTMSVIAEIVQSLQQPKRPKYFKCEMEPKYKHIGAVKGIYGSGFRTQNLMYGLPKTIINSQGQKELVGSYIY